MNIGDVCQILGQVAPLHLAQEWDNVGLLAGDEAADCASILLTIDLTPEVLDEAVRHKVALIMAYHPPLFKPISSLRAGSLETDSLVWRAIRAGIAIYSMHTALDAADGGTCDVLAKICGAVQLQPFEYVDDAKRKCKIVVFVPPDHADRVAEAMSAAGAGIIGQYTRCSFRIPGTGTFLGSQTSNPAIGKAGRYETGAELRLEMVVPQEAIPAVVSAVRNSHPYEEPAFDIYPLQPRTVGGIGRIGILPEPVSVTALLADLKKKDMAAEASRLGAGIRWLPELLRTPAAIDDAAAQLAGLAGRVAADLAGE